MNAGVVVGYDRDPAQRARPARVSEGGVLARHGAQRRHRLRVADSRSADTAGVLRD